MIKDMVDLVLCSTDAEAANLGIFLQHTLATVSRWRVRTCSGLPSVPPVCQRGACCL